MNCEIIKDLIPLYIDGCCSEQSEALVKEHIARCDSCKALFEDMRAPTDTAAVSEPPKTFRKLNDWKASILQSVLLFFSFALITVGVALEAKTPWGFGNGFWACNLVIPATGFMLSLANWYFVRLYKTKKQFSYCSLIATALITVGAYIWSGFHYGIDFSRLLLTYDLAAFSELLYTLLLLNGLGIFLTVLFCLLSKLLSSRYARMLGKA